MTREYRPLNSHPPIIELGEIAKGQKTRPFIIRTREGIEILRGRLAKHHTSDIGHILAVETDDEVGVRIAYDDGNHEYVEDTDDDDKKKRMILRVVGASAVVLVGVAAAAEIYRHFQKSDDGYRNYGIH